MQCNHHSTHHYTPPGTHGRQKCAHHRRKRRTSAIYAACRAGAGASTDDSASKRDAGPGPRALSGMLALCLSTAKTKTTTKQKSGGIRDVQRHSTLLGVRTLLCGTEEGHASHCTTTRYNGWARCHSHTLPVHCTDATPINTGYGARHAVQTTTDGRPAASAWSRRNWRRRGCASRPWLASSSARSFPATPI